MVRRHRPRCTTAIRPRANSTAVRTASSFSTSIICSQFNFCFVIVLREYDLHVHEWWVGDVGTQEDIYKKSMARVSFTMVMLALAAGMALLLGMIGIYGVISYSVTQKTREIGIRTALGASESQVVSMFVYRGLRLSVVGVVLGLRAESITANKPFGDRMTDFAKRKDATTAQLSLAWLPAQNSFLVPIPGTGKGRHLQGRLLATLNSNRAIAPRT